MNLASIIAQSDFLAQSGLLAEAGLAAGIPIGIPLGMPIGMALGTSAEKKKQAERITAAMQSGQFSVLDREGKPISVEQFLELIGGKCS